jgi:hypothetical protein
MKIGKSIATLLLSAISIYSFSQTCVDPLRTISYDTTVYGSGNAFHNFSFPRFDPTLGTLMEITLESEITLRYSFQLENRESITISNYRVRVTREDEVNSAALLTPFYYSQIRTYGPYSLAAQDGNPGSGPDYRSVGPLYVMNRALASQTIYNTADYLGLGNVDFDYSATTFSSVLGSVNYTFNATAQDTVRFRITYSYCASWFLRADVMVFDAIKNSETDIDLHWRTEDEEPHRRYELQKSYDGKKFETITTQNSVRNSSGTGMYRNSYKILSDDERHGRLIFRLKQIEKDGTEKFSMVKVVDIRKNEPRVLRISPNPARSQALVLFGNNKRGNWRVEIFTSNGNLVKQYQFSNAVSGRLQALEHLKAGIYFVKAIDTSTGEIRKTRLVVAN